MIQVMLFRRPEPTSALAQMLAEDAANGIDVWAAERLPPEPSTYDSGLRIDPADWPAPTAHIDEDTERLPAKRGERVWSAEQVAPELPGGES